MFMHSNFIFVIAATAFSFARPAVLFTQVSDPITDPIAYAIYAKVLPARWAGILKGPMLLRQETWVPSGCSIFGVARDDPEWVAIEDDFRRANLRVRILQPVLPIDIPYRLIPQAEINAEGARLAAKYPGIWNRRPEQTDYASVSAVGFNPTKTKAVVHVSVGQSGEYVGMELRDGTWVEARGGCGWII